MFLNRVCLFTSAPSCNKSLTMSVRWTLLQDEELSYHAYYSHPQAFRLATSDEPSWLHHHSLHHGSLERVADWFLGIRGRFRVYSECTKFLGKKLYWSPLLNNTAGYRPIKKRLQHSAFEEHFRKTALKKKNFHSLLDSSSHAFQK